MLPHLIYGLKLKKYTKRISTHQGFTLIELLITISILAILGAISSSVFNNIQENNRDQKRLRDLSSIKQALELYRSQNSSYPSNPEDLTPDYLDGIPEDPFYNTPYPYRSYPTSPVCTSDNKDCTSFIICARSEGNGTYDLPSDCAEIPCDNKGNNCNMGVAPD